MTPEEKSQSTIMWILMIVIGIISPVIFMLIGKDKPGIYRSSMQALTFCIFLFIIGVVLAVLAIPLAVATHGLFGLLLFPIWAVIGLFSLYVIIMGVVNSNNGVVYEPPFTSQFAKKWFNV